MMRLIVAILSAVILIQGCTVVEEKNKPVAVTLPADSIDFNSARLKGTITPNNLVTDCFFEWGTDSTLENSTNTKYIDLSVINENVEITIKELSENQRYYYRFVGKNSMGISFGEILNFSTYGINKISEYESPSNVISLCSTAEYVYVADATYRCYILDVSDPETPYELSHISELSQFLRIKDNKLLSAFTPPDDPGVGIYDISSPSSPDLITLIPSLYYIEGFDLSDGYLYIAMGSSGLLIFNIMNPSNPQQIGSFATDGYTKAVWIEDTIAYLADADKGIKVVNIKDKSNPIAAGSINTPGTAIDLVLDNGILYVADNYYGLRIIDVSTPSNPIEIGHLDTDGYALHLVKKDKYIFLADYDKGLKIINVEDNESPYQIYNYISRGSIYDVSIDEELLYLADESYGVIIIDISNMPK